MSTLHLHLPAAQGRSARYHARRVDAVAGSGRSRRAGSGVATVGRAEVLAGDPAEHPAGDLWTAVPRFTGTIPELGRRR